MSFLQKAEDDSDSLITCGRAFQRLGAELEKALKPTAFWNSFHPHLEHEGETVKMTKEIVVVPSEESALEDIVELCLWSSCKPVKDSGSI